MIKLVGGGIWVCAVTLASVYFSVQYATAPAADPGAGKKADQEYVKGEAVNIPLIGNDAVTGYFITKISYMVDKEKAKDLKAPLSEMTTDELYTLLVGNKMIDIGNTKAFDIAAFRTDLKKSLNARLGSDLIDQVLVEQLDYLSRDQIRASEATSGKKELKPLKIVEGTPPPSE